MPTRLDSLVIDTPDPAGLARWWSQALAWTATRTETPDGPEEFVVRPRESEPGLELVFGEVHDVKRGKNRVHLDLASQSLQDQRDIVDRLVQVGARPVDIGQGDVPWVVLADPEGNEFCVLRAPAPA